MAVSSMLHGSFCTSLSRDLGRKGCGLARALEADGTTRLPGNDVTRRIGDGDDRVVERTLDMGLTHSDVLALRATDTRRVLVLLLWHTCSLAPLPRADLTFLALAGASVSVRALSVDREALAMTKATVTANLHQAGGILTNLAT